LRAKLTALSMAANFIQKIVPLYRCTAVMIPTVGRDVLFYAMDTLHVRAVEDVLAHTICWGWDTLVLPGFD
jgi:hypothetical protein